MINPNENLINSGWKFVAAASGGGQEILGELTRHGGMSNTLLEAIIPYSFPAFEKLIGGHTDQIVSPQAARAAAMACYNKARQYAPDSNVFGFASTGSVVKVNGERQGREHKVCMAIQDYSRTIGINIVLRVQRTREEEEKLVANCIRQALQWGCHNFGDIRRVLHEDDHMNVESCLALPEHIALVHGSINKVTKFSEPARGVFSSSCNPLHSAHLAIIEDAAWRLQSPIDVELCVKNGDKPPLDYLTIRERMEATTELLKGNPNIRQIVLTNKPLFFDKVGLFSGTEFIVGHDTYDRIMDCKYYQNGLNAIINGLFEMKESKCTFLVYPRKGYKSHNAYLCGSLRESVTQLVKDFDTSDVSSTAIRAELRNANQ